MRHPTYQPLLVLLIAGLCITALPVAAADVVYIDDFEEGELDENYTGDLDEFEIDANDAAPADGSTQSLVYNDVGFGTEIVADNIDPEPDVGGSIEYWTNPTVDSETLTVIGEDDDSEIDVRVQSDNDQISLRTGSDADTVDYGFTDEWYRIVAEIGENEITVTAYDSNNTELVSITEPYSGTYESKLAFIGPNTGGGERWDLIGQELDLDIQNETADPNQTDVTSSPVELSIDVEWTLDSDVTLEFYDAADNSFIGTDTIEGSGTGATDWDTSIENINEWYVEATADGQTDTSEVFHFNSNEPELTNPDPVAGDSVFDSPIELSVDVGDSDFDSTAGDEVTIDWEHNEEPLETTKHSENETAIVTVDEPDAGKNTWTITATDDYGNTVTQSYEYQAPDELEIRDESDPDTLVTTDAEISVTFFDDDEDEVYERTTTDGVVSMEGLPADTTFTAQVNADGFINRQVIIPSILEQQEVYVLPDDADFVETDFVLSDPTGQFRAEDSRVYVKKPITRDGSVQQRVVAADDFGAAGFSAILERDQRYLIEVEDIPAGDTRNLGPYVATSSQTVKLEIDQLDFEFSQDLDDVGSYSWGAQYLNDTEPAIEFTFQGTELEIEWLEVTITERNGDTVLLEETYTNVTTVQELATIPSDIENPQTRTWNVHWEARVSSEQTARAGLESETIEGSEVVGPTQMPIDLPGVDGEILSLVAILGVLVIGGLFSAANVSVGGIVTALTAGALWMIGIMPDAVSGITIAVALTVAVMYHAQRGPPGGR